nr:DUF4326 domain-containing protein [Ursidibacter maritimus]
MSRSKELILVALEDKNKLIERYSSVRGYSFIFKDQFNLNDITHAIIFDDGEEFKEELNLIKAYKLPFRFIEIKITRVINIDREDPYQYGDKYEYIGRNPKRDKNKPIWSNPYSMYDFQIGEDSDELSRDSVIQKFAYGFERDNLPTNLKKEDTHQLAGKRLGCHCKPEKCHGDIIADYLNSLDDGK